MRVAREREAGAGPDTSHLPRGEAPVRTCIGCRSRATKSELLRLTVRLDAEGRVAVAPDPTATAPGRGAHLHPTRECFDLAVRRKAFSRALRHAGALPVEALSSYLDAL